MGTTWYAHVRRDESGEIMARQTVAEHLRGTAELCRRFAGAFGGERDGELAGLAHDMGKCTPAFQARLLRDGPRVDHATAGALACDRRNAIAAAICVAGHHGGLPDFGNRKADGPGEGTFAGRMKRGTQEGLLERCGDSGAALPENFVSGAVRKGGLRASFWTRML